MKKAVMVGGGPALQVGGHRLHGAQAAASIARANSSPPPMGVEGSLLHAASILLRDEIAAQGSVTFQLDLLPDQRMHYHSIS